MLLIAFYQVIIIIINYYLQLYFLNNKQCLLRSSYELFKC